MPKAAVGKKVGAANKISSAFTNRRENGQQESKPTPVHHPDYLFYVSMVIAGSSSLQDKAEQRL